MKSWHNCMSKVSHTGSFSLPFNRYNMVKGGILEENVQKTAIVNEKNIATKKKSRHEAFDFSVGMYFRKRWHRAFPIRTW